MKATKKQLSGKLPAVIFAFVVAIGILFGGVFSVTAHADEHGHTFAEEWTAGYKNHWHAATCGCAGLVSDMEPHKFDANNNCTVCRNPKEDPAHVHTFETKWTYDEDNHWHAADAACGHNIVQDIAAHTLTDGKCACGYDSGESGENPPVVNPPVIKPNPPELEDPKDAEVPEGIDRSGGYNEGLFAEWTADKNTDMSTVTASYSVADADKWSSIDSELIRISGTTARVDAVGLTAGKYDLKINFPDGAKTVENIEVTAHDRSGYAHFEYTDGVGAYKDDGTLKDGALVIYLKDSNKNDLTGYSYKNVNGTLVKEDISAYFWQGHKGIGYLLNNRGYGNNTERANYGIQKLAFTYGAVAIRVLDNVNAEVSASEADASKSLIEGLTAYNSTDQGGSTGDNGRMARITNAKNLTIEGIGEDGGIYGWGVHFVSNDNLHTTNYEAGKGFEVRNITFEHYPEDAVGMEGTQGTKVDQTGSITSGASDAGAKLISPVQRCWVHNNVFKPGFCAKPAESDKREGDGSCDFKRGRYYTLAYNYFVDCHKTNLIGSSSNSVTYDVTMHHNWWDNCGARQPLARRANIHFYNNYISGDMSRDPKPALSYVSSIRAATYMFMEANYYDGCKQVVVDGGEGGGSAAKSWNNVYYACFSTDASTHVTGRTQKVANSCKFIAENIDYSAFDTDPKYFYYDTETRQSDCLLDDAVTARMRVMMFAGVNGFGKSKDATAMNKYTPDSAVKLSESGDTVINIGTSGNGVVFNGVKSGKFKGQGITFTLPAGGATLTVTTTTPAGDSAPELVRADGAVYAAKFTGTIQVELPEGTYFIGSGQKDKESVITEMKFTASGNASEARIEAAETAIKAIPAADSESFAAAVKAAQTAYNNLSEKEKESIGSTLSAKLESAKTALVQKVIGHINDIGTVNEDSYDKINKAQSAYDALTADLKEKVTNYKTLADAQTEFGKYAVQNLEKLIANLPDLSKLDIGNEEEVTNAIDKYNEAYSAYTDLDDEQRPTVAADSVKKITDGLAALKPLPNLFSFINALDEVVDAAKVTLSDGNAVIALYKLLTTEQIAKLTDAQKTKYAQITEKVKELASKTVTLCFTSGKEGYQNESFTVNGSTRSGSVVVGDVTYTLGMKMESSTSISFTTSTKMTLTLYFDSGSAGRKLKIDGVSKTVEADGTLTIQLEAGQHTITKESTNVNLFLLTLKPASA